MSRKFATLSKFFLRAVVFGCIGAGACWLLATSLRDALRARDFVGVKAEAISADMALANTKPSFAGRWPGIDRYWLDETADFLQAAADAKRAITVAVNPGDPASAVVDRGIRWGPLSFIAPVALVASMVYLASLYGFYRAAGAPATDFEKPPSEEYGMWVFTTFVNVLAFRLAGRWIPGLVQDGFWVAWFILILPLLGMILAWLFFEQEINDHRVRYS